MSKSSRPIRDAMVALAHEQRRGPEHPSTSRLISYYREEIPPAEAAAIREHLSLCQDCAALVLDAAEFFADDDEDEAAPADLEASWEELQAARTTTESRPQPEAPSPARPPSIPRRSLPQALRFAYGLAATFAAVCIGLLVFRPSGAPPQPQVNPGLYDLSPSSAERGDSAQATPIRFQSPDGSALLILNPAVVASSARHGVRIRQADGAVLWRSEALVPQASGGFHLNLPAAALPPGRYSVELYGVTQGRETTLGTYTIAIEK